MLCYVMFNSGNTVIEKFWPKGVQKDRLIVIEVVLGVHTANVLVKSQRMFS